MRDAPPKWHRARRIRSRSSDCKKIAGSRVKVRPVGERSDQRLKLTDAMLDLAYFFAAVAVLSGGALLWILGPRWLHDRRVLRELRGIAPMSKRDWEVEDGIRADLMVEFREPETPSLTETRKLGGLGGCE